MPSALPEVFRPQMEDAIRTLDAGLWDRYESHRGNWLANAATSRLEAALPGSTSWTAVSWASASDDSDLDGLVHCDDLALRVQAKAGRISPAARRGAPSMREDVTNVVSDAMVQHARLAKALTCQTSAELGFSPEQAAALESPLQIEVVVCLDDVTLWSTETHKLHELVVVPDTAQVPWVLSLSDLMATTDLLDGAQLAHFLTRRQRLEMEGRIEAHDELDWVGHYIRDGLFFDNWLEGPDAPDVFSLTTYTEAIDSWYLSRAGVTNRPFPKPAQSIPAGLGQLIRRLEHDRPAHWLTAGMLLLNGDEQSHSQLAETIDHTQARAVEAGWSNGSQVFAAYGITLWVDGRFGSTELTGLLGDYSDRKIGDLRRPNWIAVGLGNDRKISLVVRETQPDLTLQHVLLRRLSPTGAPDEPPQRRG